MPSMEQRVLDVDLNEIVVYARIVQLGSFSKAAISLGLPKSTVSRRIAQLEQRVGARLLQRTTRRLATTDVGRIYYEHCARVVAELEEAQLAVAQLQSMPRGLLRVTVPLAFAVLGPVLTEFLGRYPEVQVELLATDRRVDLVEERFDLAIRAGVLVDSGHVARRLGVVRRILVAAPTALARMGELRDPPELERHPALVFAPEGNTWRLAYQKEPGGHGAAKTAEVALRPRLIANDYDMLRTVACAGYGVALLPEFLCAEELRAGRLRRLLAPWAAPEMPVVALYPSTRHLPPKVLALLELLRERLQLGAST